MTEKEYKSSREKNDMYIINFKKKAFKKSAKYYNLRNIDSNILNYLKETRYLRY